MIFLKHFRHYYIKYGWAFIIGITTLILIDYFQLEVPRMINIIITGVENNAFSSVRDIFPYLQYIVLIVAGLTFGRFLWRYLLFGTGRKIETDIRNHMFGHATLLSQNFYSNEKIGGLMSYFINDINAVRELFGFGLLMLVDGIVLGTLVLTRMFSLNWTMTLYAAIPLLIVGVFVAIMNIRMSRKFKERQKRFEEMSDYAQESFTGISVIKAYVREISEAINFNHRSKKLKDQTLNHMKSAVIVNIIIEVMLSLVVLSILVYGSILIASGTLDSGGLTEYISYFFTLLWPITAIAMFLNLNGQAQASAQRIKKFLDSKIDVYDLEKVKDDIELTGGIKLNNLTFKYEDSENNALENISFEVKPGEMLGILGKTGSGKSTIVELLLHVYNVKDNMLSFDNIDINEIPIKTLREHIGYVPQDNFLFSDTIKNNIGFGLTEIDDDKLVEVAKLSDIHDNVMEFHLQYETILGERGTTVSGGQKQRISIARALAKDPTILILDDSVSAVDTKTEEAIITNLRKVRKGKTTIMIAHRVSTVKKLDKIAVIEEGRLVGFGTHQELIKNNPIYQDMVKRQELEHLVGEVAYHA